MNIISTKKSPSTEKNVKALLLLIFSVLATALSHCTDDGDGIAPNTPAYFLQESEKLSIPTEVAIPNAEDARVATYYAKGVQIYNAQVIEGSDPVAYQWVFASPSANLYNERNELVGSHFAGPSWQLNGGDKINGQQFTPAKTKNVDAGSVDWLLLKPKTGSISTGIFSNVEYIQRIATIGGKAPATPPASASETTGVPYTAVYRFSKAN